MHVRSTAHLPSVMDPGHDYKHVPVLVAEVLRFLRPHADGLYVDATTGEGGHCEALLQASAPTARVIGIDRDAEVLDVARQRLACFGTRVHVLHGHTIDIRTALDGLGVSRVDGILLDLGISSYQLEKSERGFSFMRDGPLDMRMDRNAEQTAAMLINALEEAELIKVIQNYGEERWARRIARAITRARRRAPLRTTQELAALITQVVPSTPRPGRIHPATRTFQAFRIAVNQELSKLEGSLRSAAACLNQGGRLCVIAYHSLEDRIVKRTFQALAAPPDETVPGFRLLTRKPVISSINERQTNPRARSAKLRVLERL
jgi:16S rRNA (cytosine1402-N4)-methyltransferase